MRCTVAISSSGNSLRRYKKVSILKNIIRKMEKISKRTKSRLKLVRYISLISGTVSENPGRMVTSFLSPLKIFYNLETKQWMRRSNGHVVTVYQAPKHSTSKKRQLS
jgi:hypothetical protein